MPELHGPAVDPSLTIAGMLEDLRLLVEAESPSDNLESLDHCATVMSAMGERHLGAPPLRSSVDGRPLLQWRIGDGRPGVLLVGHLDTVWPVGTLAERPFAAKEGVAYGPGVFDMKAGLVIALWALRSLEGRCNATLLINADEELGSPGSSSLIRQAAKDSVAALVLEPSHHGRLKTRRWGRTEYEFRITGRTAHAGLAASEGANAVSELGRVIQQVNQFSQADVSVVPTMCGSGIAANVIPAFATLTVDVRYRDQDANALIDKRMREVAPSSESFKIKVDTGHASPPLEHQMSSGLFDFAQDVAHDLRLGPLEEAEVGGGSDGNTCASVGCVTLDGLGAVGDGAHAETEYVELRSLPERSALVAGLVRRLSSR